MNGDPRPAAQPRTPRRWVGATVVLAIVVTPVAILIASNRDSAAVRWAGFEWNAPGWLVLTATFVAGAIGGRVLGWLWRSWRRRRRRLAEARPGTRHDADGRGG